MQSIRHEKLIALVEEKGLISTSELANQLTVSRATIQRDLDLLQKQKRIIRNHGGAKALTKPTVEDVPLSKRRLSHREEKTRIAAAALDYIIEGETIYLHSGTTTFELAVKLRALQNLTILTNDLDIAYEVINNSTNNLIVAGGVRKKLSSTLIGYFTEQMLEQFYVDKAFISVDAVYIEAGFMDYNIEEIAIKRTMIKNSRKHIVLCDHSKFENSAFMSICPLDAIDLVITSIGIDKDKLQKFEGFNIDIQIV